MGKINRNTPCPCGSGRKYKKCCGKEDQPHLDGLPAGLRMKGGIRYDDEVNGFVPIIHTWDNVQCQGEPTEWQYPKVFQTEEDAMSYYKRYIRPDLQQLMSKIKKQNPDDKSIYRKLD